MLFLLFYEDILLLLLCFLPENYKGLLFYNTCNLRLNTNFYSLLELLLELNFYYACKTKIKKESTLVLNIRNLSLKLMGI